MKKIFLFILISLCSIAAVFAQASGKQDDIPEGLLGGNTSIVTYTSEPDIAGKNCTLVSGSGQYARYRCTVSGTHGFIDFITSIYKYVFFICLVIGVLLVVIMGIGMSISGIGSEELKANAKSKLMDILGGLLALAIIPWLLKTVAPFFFK